MWHSRQPDYSYMREIGCRSFVFIPTHNPKILPRSIKCVLIGYGANSKTYRCWDPKNKKVYQAYHIKFIEQHKLLTAANIPPPIAESPIPSLCNLNKNASLVPDQSDNNNDIGFNIENTNPATLPE